MAMTDFFYNCQKVETQLVADGIGGYQESEYLGITFKGLAVKKSETEQLIGALRGQEKIQYNFHTYTNVPLHKDDKVAFTEKGETKYLRLTSDAIVNTELSMQTDWNTYNAESYEPIFVTSTSTSTGTNTGNGQ